MVKRFESLDAFRGLCAISVVLFHMHVAGSITELKFARGSYIFVEFFFVLSGFVLAHGYGFRDDLKFKPYVKARFFRLYPLHLFMLIVMIGLEFIKLFTYKYAGFSFHIEPFDGNEAVNQIIPNLLLLQSWTPFTIPVSFNGPAWSISIEFYMYILLFMSIFLFKTKKTIVWLVISLFMLYGLFTDSEFLRTEVFRGLSCFFGGAFMYTIYKNIKEIKLNYNLISLIEVALLLAVIYVVRSDFEHKNIIAITLFFIVVPTFAFESGILSSILRKKSFQLIGKLSFSIYMIHNALLFSLELLMRAIQKTTGIETVLLTGRKLELTTGNIFTNNILVVLFLIVVLYLSHYSYKYIELKGQKLGKRI